MAFVDDVAADRAIWDGSETVTLRQIRTTGATNTTVNYAINSPLSKRQIQSAGGIDLTGKERSWSLNSTDVGASGVAVGDLIIDSGSRIWKVVSVDNRTVDSRWLCVTIQEES